MKLNRRPLLAIIPAAALAGSMLTAPVAGAQSSLPAEAFGSLGGSLGSSADEGSNQCQAETELVNEDNLEGSKWSTPSDETPAVLAELAEVAEDGAPAAPGALHFPDDVEGKPGTSLYKAVDIELADLIDEDGKLTPIGFSYFSDATAPALQLRITGANYYDFEADVAVDKPAAEGTHFESGFATIVLSPEASNGAWKTLTPEQIAESSEFWVTKSIAAVEGANDGKALIRGERTTLADIIKMNPEANLDEVGVQKTRENDTANTYIDNFLFDCVTTDFELDAPEPTDPEEPSEPAGPDFGSLALGGGLALAAALAIGGGAFALQNGMIQLPPEIAALLNA